MNTKRLMKIAVSAGQRLGGLYTISSGTELYIPSEFRGELDNAHHSECEIIGKTHRTPSVLSWRERINRAPTKGPRIVAEGSKY